jgi:hypothetical protein
LLLFGVACKDEATIACQAELAKAQGIVKSSGSTASGVKESLAAVDAALSACRAAGRTSESEELSKARSELASHLEVLNQRSGRQRRAKPSAAETEELIKHGDPSCPRGMAYKAEDSDKQVRCIGPQPIRMPWAKVREYYKAQGFRVDATDAPPTLRVEYGAERIVFGYEAANSANAPKCLTYYPAPGIPWQEAVARVTGADLRRIKRDSPVPLPDGDVPLHVDETKDKLVIALGACSP